MNKVSIIVPVYNTKDYIIRCVDSLVNQTYKNIEIILVNDGSLDDSINLVNEKYDDDRIVIVNQENMGSGQARNNGIKKATGDYLFFVDSDDFIDKDTISIMMNKMINDKVNLVICDYYKYFSDDNKIHINNIPNYDCNNDKQSVIGMPGAVCKLFKKEIFDKYDIKFLPGVFFEDNAIIPFVCAVSGKYAYVNKPLYYYFQREGSALNKIEYNEGYEAIFDSLSYLYDKFNKYDMIEKYAQELEYIYIEYLLHASNLRFLKFNKLNNIKKVSIIMKEKYPNYRHNKYFKMENIKYRIVCNLFYKNKVKLLKLILK